MYNLRTDGQEQEGFLENAWFQKKLLDAVTDEVLHAVGYMNPTQMNVVGYWMNVNKWNCQNKQSEEAMMFGFVPPLSMDAQVKGLELPRGKDL